MFTVIIVGCSLKNMCVPSFIVIGYCVSELHGHIHVCPYRNVLPEVVYCWNYIVNPRRACAARVTVVVVWVCHSVCYARTHFSSHRSRQKQAHIPICGRRSENMWDFL